MGFPRQEYWSGLRFPISGELFFFCSEFCHTLKGIKPVSPWSPALQADYLPAEPIK